MLKVWTFILVVPLSLVCSLRGYSAENCDVNMSLTVNFQQAFTVDVKQRKAEAEGLNHLLAASPHDAKNPPFIVAPDLKPTLESKGENLWKLQVYTAKTSSWSDSLVADKLVAESPEWVSPSRQTAINLKTSLSASTETEFCPEFIVVAVEKSLLRNEKTRITYVPTDDNETLGYQSSDDRILAGINELSGVSGFVLVRKSHRDPNGFNTKYIDPGTVQGF